MESNERYYRRRAAEELAAARRALTPAARSRRMTLVHSYLERLRELGFDLSRDALWSDPELAVTPKARDWILEAS